MSRFDRLVSAVDPLVAEFNGRIEKLEKTIEELGDECDTLMNANTDFANRLNQVEAERDTLLAANADLTKRVQELDGDVTTVEITGLPYAEKPSDGEARGEPGSAERRSEAGTGEGVEQDSHNN